MAKDNWKELCRLAEQDDGLPIRPAHSGSIDKLYWWSRYLTTTSNAMVGRTKWPTSIVYVDLFAGPGVLEADGTRYPGSPLLAANVEKQFQRLMFCEKDVDLATALTTRLRTSPAADRSIVFVGDCNARIGDVVAAIPQDSLTIAFIDPTGLHASFNTLRALCTGRSVDLLILVPTEMDIHRNLDAYYLPQEWSKLDEVLGERIDWRKRYQELASRTRNRVSRFFLEVYKERLQTQLDYTEFGDEVIRRGKKAIYRILFASKHPLGLHFWNIASKKQRQGGSLPFE